MNIIKRIFRAIIDFFLTVLRFIKAFLEFLGKNFVAIMVFGFLAYALYLLTIVTKNTEGGTT